MDTTFKFESQWKLRPEFPNGRKATVEQILGSDEIHKYKRAGLSELQPGVLVEKLTI